MRLGQSWTYIDNIRTINHGVRMEDEYLIGRKKAMLPNRSTDADSPRVKL